MMDEEDDISMPSFSLDEENAPEAAPPLSIRERLQKSSPRFKATVMPDFFIDYILTFHGSLDDMTLRFGDVANRGGGNLLGWKHTIGRGGKASNFAAQLGKLGATTIPIIETNPLGQALLSHFADYLDLSHIKTDGTLSSTVSLETLHNQKKVNLMISNTGTLANFGPGRLTEEDKELIRSADYVCLVSWNLLDKGTDLAETIFSLAKEAGKTITFFDPGDPSLRKADLQDLTERVLTKGLVDILSVNENELFQLAPTVQQQETEEGEAALFEAASVFSMLGSRVDLHTSKYSATFVDGQRERYPCLKIEPSKVTGAGDAWNAGDIYGQGIGLSHKERLLFANATAAAYLSKPGLEPAEMKEVLVMVDKLEKEVALSTASSQHTRQKVA